MKNLLTVGALSMIGIWGGYAQSNDVAQKPNFIWLVLEDTSPYQFSCYGNKDIQTPEIDRLANQGIRFTHAIANAPHCSAARSSLITGCYATTYGMDIHRELYITPENIFYPNFLRAAGYYCTNNDKTDYNTTVDNNAMWDECSNTASYNSPKRKPGQPFFAVFNTAATHMGTVRTITTDGRPDLKTQGIDAANISVPPFLPDLPEVRSDEAVHLNAARGSGPWAQAFLDDLKAKGLADNTIVFFFSDHGGCMPRGKGTPFETGLRIPLIIYVPPVWQQKFGLKSGMVDDRLVSFVDFAPTVMSMAGIKPPAFMQGIPFLGKYAGKQPKYQFAFRSNQENYHFDPCRTVCDGKYKYIRNYIPYKPFCLRNLYQWGMPANLAWDEYVMTGKWTNEIWMEPFKPKEAEMLFDLEKDPWELNNLADDPQSHNQLIAMRKALSAHIRETGDLGLVERSLRNKKQGLYQWVRDEKFPLAQLYEAAELASMPTSKDVKKLAGFLESPYPEVRFWGAVGFNTLAYQGKIKQLPDALKKELNDESSAVACTVAESVCCLGDFNSGAETLIHYLRENDNQAYSSLETLTWYPRLKEKLMQYLPVLSAIAEDAAKNEQSRMDLGVKVRSILVNLGDLPISQLYSENERQGGVKANKNGRKFTWPNDIKPVKP